MSSHRRLVRVLVAGAVALAGLALVAGPASAHIEPHPNQVKSGKRATVEFNVEHGCAASPTIKLTFQIPKGAKKVAPQAKTGWTTSVKNGTVIFDGGPLDAKTPDTFAIAFTAPKKKTLLVWNVIQDCEQGKTRWIDRSKGAENPPPIVGVGKKPPAD
jgi:uncharacterized protein YcnI